MKDHIRIPGRVCLCAALFVATAALAPATTLLRLSLERMTHSARAIVRARCVANASGWDAGEIWTFTTFEVQETWKGSPPPQLTVRLLGGRVGQVTSSVSGVPRFGPGEEVVLFLEPTARGDFSVVGWEEGTFRVRQDPRTGESSVTEDSASLATFDPATRRFDAEGIQHMLLDTFRSRVAQLVQEGEGRKR